MRLAAHVVAAVAAAVGCGGPASPSAAPAASAPVPPVAVSPPAATMAPAPRASAAPAAPGIVPDGTLPSLAGVLPGAGITVPAGGVVDWVPPIARLRADARTTAPWLARLEGEAVARWSAAPALEVQGLVLDGSVSLLDPTVEPPTPRTLGRWSVFRAPGGALSLRSADGAPARVVLLAATRDGCPFGALLRDPEAGPVPRRLPSASKTRPMPLEIADLHDRAALRWAGGRLEARIAWDGKEQAAALDLLVFAPDAAVGEHAHPGAWECLLPLRVAGDVVIEGAPQAVRPGEATCIPPDVKHAWRPAGTEPLIAIQVYAPAGAEQRFRDLAPKTP